MSNKEFSLYLVPKVSSICDEIVNYYKVSYKKAREILYNSKLYTMLEKENTKMWYFSYFMLFDMLKEEIETVVLNVPRD